jgi:hypothetical protein
MISAVTKGRKARLRTMGGALEVGIEEIRREIRQWGAGCVERNWVCRDVPSRCSE